jgi:hypothetical protein
MDQFPLNYITANGLRGIKVACWRALCGKFKKIFIGKMGQFPLNNVTASQEKTVEWLTYISSNIIQGTSKYQESLLSFTRHCNWK